MKRLFTIIISAFLIFTPLTAFDWGGFLDNNSAVIKSGTSEAYFNQSNSLFLWASNPLGENMYIKGVGMFKYNIDTVSKEFRPNVDLDMLKVAGDFNIASGLLRFSAGRFNFTDKTGAIFSQNSDGAVFQFDGQAFGVSLYAGFTGLLNSNTVNILDETGTVYAPINGNGIYDLNKSYLPIVASVTLPSLFLNQTLSAEASGFIDLTSSKYNRMYATLDLTGPITSFLFYDFTTSLGTSNFDNFMNYSNLSIMIFPLKNIFINTGVMFASKNFNGFSSHPAYNASVDVQIKDCVVPSVTANISLFKNKMLVTVAGKGVVALNPVTSVHGSGFQGDASVIYNIFPDLQVGLSGSMFKAFSDNTLDKFSATLKFAVTF